MTPAGWIGVWLLAAAGVAIVAEGLLAAIWGMAIGKRARLLAERIETERVGLEADVERLRLAVEEMARLWRPYRYALRRLRHPLVVALLRSYARRGAAA
ncbi:hypothetical protein EPN29_06340 [bacterium]|nr:MAG: hypothetical protein EPN29_06340 [bacterium]